jgi:hypothetical protein
MLECTLGYAFKAFGTKAKQKIKEFEFCQCTLKNIEMTNKLKPFPFNTTATPEYWIEKLNPIYDFLSKNREYNKILHDYEYLTILRYFKDDKDKIMALLHYIANTQSQPKLNSLYLFFEQLNKSTHWNH